MTASSIQTSSAIIKKNIIIIIYSS
jgi:hypothetical protein